MTDLAARCREILEWKRTGNLVGGSLRELAASLHYIPAQWRLGIAEKRTADEAMQFVIDAHTPASPPREPVRGQFD